MTYCGYVDVVVVLILIVLSSFVSVLISVMSLFLSNAGMMVLTLKIFTLGFFSDLEILFSMWSLLFLVMVLFISVSVLLFSYSYFSVNNVSGFMVLYLAFITSMVWLIVNQNFYWMMLGWDGLGVTSFLLIIHYMNNESVNNGLFTIFQNRVGDLFFVLFLVSFGNLSMQMNFYVTSSVIFLMLGAAVKSAQYPFNTWLLAAMSAPTPISSLVHSSTLVVAGVYVMLQYSYCLMEWLDILKYMSMVTLIVSFIGLMNESDMKKLIAYSTMSHVGLMMYMFSLQLYKVVYFHLNIHAMFKSLMFMCFGFLMLASYHSQDKRLVSIHSVNPVIKMFYNFSCMCLMGLPFLSAFFSKDFILEKAIEMSGDMSSFFLLLLFLSVSVFYGMKLLSLFPVMFSYSLLEKQFLGGMSLGIMVLVMLGMVNLFISLIFSVSLELMDLKLVVYLYMLSFLVLASLMKFNYKLISVSKVNLFKEMWLWNWYSLDQYVYWTYLLVVGYVNMMSSVKLLLMVNWWVVVVVIFLF